MMYTAVMILAAGCDSMPMLPAGRISVTQQMVAVFRKGGVDLIALVVGPKDKKLEKQIARPGWFSCTTKNLKTASEMLDVAGDVVIPICEGKSEQPVLLPDWSVLYLAVTTV